MTAGCRAKHRGNPTCRWCRLDDAALGVKGQRRLCLPECDMTLIDEIDDQIARLAASEIAGGRDPRLGQRELAQALLRIVGISQKHP
jgi:hypothetical protein